MEEIKLRTKRSIETSTRLIHESSCLIQKSYRNLHRVNRSSELPEGILETMDSLGPPSSCGPGASDHGHSTLDCEKEEAHTRCDHGYGILLNNKAYRVRTGTSREGPEIVPKRPRRIQIVNTFTSHEHTRKSRFLSEIPKNCRTVVTPNVF
jgi:hypothetical protein